MGEVADDFNMMIRYGDTDDRWSRDSHEQFEVFARRITELEAENTILKEFARQSSLSDEWLRFYQHATGTAGDRAAREADPDD